MPQKYNVTEEEQPFPYNEEEMTDDWLDETDEQNPIVPDDVIKHDREVWLSVR